MATTLIDSDYFAGMFTSSRMKEIFCDEARFQAWLDVEAALARAQARLGIIPEDADGLLLLEFELNGNFVVFLKFKFDKYDCL